MKSVIFAVAATSAFAVSLAAFAQSDTAPRTRAEVRAELQQIEQAGYNPAAGKDRNYPQDIQAAERRLSYGGVKSGSSASGSPAIAPADSPDNKAINP